MSDKAFFRIAGAVFGLVAIAHLVRIVMALSITIGGWAAPMWMSWAALIVAGGLSIMGFRFAKG